MELLWDWITCHTEIVNEHLKRFNMLWSKCWKMKPAQRPLNSFHKLDLDLGAGNGEGNGSD